MSGACAPYPRASQVPRYSPRAPPPLPNGAQPGSLWLRARGHPGGFSGAVPGLPAAVGRGSSALRGAPGWLVFLPPSPRPYSAHLSEAGRVSEAGSCQSPRRRAERGQGQSALSMVALSLLGNWQSPARTCCRSGTGAWGQENCVPSCVASTSLDPVRPTSKMSKGNMHVPSSVGSRVGEEHGIKKQS